MAQMEPYWALLRGKLVATDETLNQLFTLRASLNRGVRKGHAYKSVSITRVWGSWFIIPSRSRMLRGADRLSISICRNNPAAPRFQPIPSTARVTTQ